MSCKLACMCGSFKFEHILDPIYLLIYIINLLKMYVLAVFAFDIINVLIII